MALKTIKTDDLDPTTEAEHELTIIIDGTAYKLDLNKTNFEAAKADLKKWVEAGQVAQTRRTSGGGAAGQGGAITHPDGTNVTKADVRKWVATKDRAWAEGAKVMQYLNEVDGKLVMAGPNYVPPVLMRMLADEERGAVTPVQAEPAPAQSEAPAQAETPKPGAPKTAPRKVAAKA